MVYEVRLLDTRCLRRPNRRYNRYSEAARSRVQACHIKHFLSGIFRYARRQGVLHSPNPMHDVEIPKGRPAGETHAYSLEEEALMLTLLPEPAATVVATAAFTGARKGELRGFLWQNYDGTEMRVGEIRVAESC